MNHKKELVSTLLFLGGIALIVLIWEVIAFATNFLFLPEFFNTCAATFVLLSQSETYISLGYSLLRLLISLLISMVAGALLGMLGGYIKWLGKLLYPLISVLRAFPTIALLLLLIIYVPSAELYVVCFVLLPVFYQAALQGTERVYSEYEDDLRMRGRWHFDNFTKVILPLSGDYLLLGLMQAVGLGLKVEIMAETFAYTSRYHGLGKLINLAYQNVDYLTMMGYVLISLLLCLILDLALYFLRKYYQGKIGIFKAQ